MRKAHNQMIGNKINLWHNYYRSKMKVKEKYEELKNQHQEEILLLKVGSFYVTFGLDAITMNYLFSYQINNEKLGFPVTALAKVTTNLRDKNISFYILEGEEVTSYMSDDNLYKDISTIAQKSYYSKFSNELLIERIKILISNSSENYNKIKEFVDGL